MFTAQTLTTQPTFRIFFAPFQIFLIVQLLKEATSTLIDPSIDKSDVSRNKRIFQSADDKTVERFRP